MNSARDVLRAVLGVAWNVGLVAIVLAMIATMSAKNWNDSSGDAPANATPAVVSVSEVGKTRMTLEVGAGEPFSNYVLEDKEGKELLLVSYDRSGGLIVTLGQAFPIRPGYSAAADGTYNFEVAHGQFDYRLKLRPGAASGFMVTGPPYGTRESVNVTAEGKITREPLSVE